MTKIQFFKRDGIYYGFEEIGHAGYAEAGEDVVCAAISAMTMLIINAVEVTYASNIKYTIDEETSNIKVMAYGALPDYESDEQKRYAISGLIEAYFLQLNDMLDEYYEYIDVTEVEA